MIISIELSDEEGDLLKNTAKALGVTPEALIRAGLSVWLSARDEGFQESAERVLWKNRDLYERLR
ncbi:MAG: DNA-binding protein [bacterium]